MLVAALPVMAVGYEEDWNGYYASLGARPEFAKGEDFVGQRRAFVLLIHDRPLGLHPLSLARWDRLLPLGSGPVW